MRESQNSHIRNIELQVQRQQKEDLYHFSGLAMQGLLSNPSLPGWLRDVDLGEKNLTVEELSIKYAKKLLKQLEEE